MARFTVLWAADVQHDFTLLWVAASSQDRQRLTNIANVVDRDLGRWAEYLGHSLPSEPDARVWFLPNFDPPVSVVYRIEPGDQTVYVVRLRLHSS